MASCIGVQAQTVDLKSVAKISHTSGNFPQTYLGNDDRFGAPTLVGDINNDGVDDLAVGAFLDDDGQTNAGAVYILFMNADETVNDVQKISNLDGNLGNIIPYNARFGHNVEALGDLNDDGVEDIAVSGWNQSSGAFYVLFLNTDGTVKNTLTKKIASGQNGFTQTLSNGVRFGADISNLGDLDGDGVIDLIVSAPKYSQVNTYDGAVFILYMNTNGTVKSHTKIASNTGGLDFNYAYNDQIGYSVTNVGDIDGDAVTDVAVSAGFDVGGTNTGGYTIFMMNTNGTVKNYMKVGEGMGGLPASALDAADILGQDLTALGDIDNDGIPDLAVNASGDDDGGSNRGAIYLMLNNTDGSLKNYIKINSTHAELSGKIDNGDKLGLRMNRARDMDGNGVQDLLIGVILDDDGGTNRGAMYVFYMDGPLTYDETYVKLKHQFDGGYYYVENQELRFENSEEYEVGDYRYVAYNIYDKNHNLVGGVDETGTPLITGSEQLDNQIGENKYKLDLSALTLTTNEYFTFEVINDKKEKKVLKFKLLN